MARINTHLLATIFLVAAAASGLSAQDHRFYDHEQLGSTLITTLGQSADGLLWVGSERGIERFDGYRFATRTSLDGTSRPTETSALLCDSSGAVWVGTSQGLFAYDRSRDDYRAVEFPDSLRPRVAALVETADGTLLAGTAGYGLYAIDRSTLVASIVAGYAPAGDDSYFNHLFRSADGTVWKSGTGSHVSARRPDGTLFGRDLAEGSPVGFFQRGTHTYALCHEGIAALTPGAPRIELPSPLPHVVCCVADDAGNIFVGTRGAGLYWLPCDATSLRRFSIAVGGVDIGRARIETLFIDRQGNLWAACSGRGLLAIALKHHGDFQTWSFAEQRQATGTYVSAIAEGGSCGGGDVAYWCSVQGDGVYGFDGVGRIVAHPDAPSGVETLMRDASGAYWLGTSHELWSYNPCSGAASLAASLPGDRVAAITELRDGRLALSIFGAGIALFDPRDHSVRQLSMHATDTAGRGRLVNDWVFSMDVDGRGRLWIGTSSGVSCYDPARASFATEGWRVLADREACTAIRALASGDVLMATTRGLLRWSAEHGLQPEAGTEALTSRSIACIMEDKRGDVWLSTDDGIWRWQPDTRRLTAQLAAEGRHAGEYVQGAGLQTTDGHLLFATADGLTLFEPSALQRRKPVTADVRLTAFLVAGIEATPQTRSGSRRIMDAPLSDSHYFTLAHTDATFRMEFSMLDFVNTSGTIFQYRLGDERQWRQLPRGENGVTFNHMAPGTYHLSVRAVCGDEVSAAQTYTVRVRPPWWLSLWAYVVYVLLIVAGVVAAAVAYRRHIRHQLDREKLSFLISATQDEATPLSLDDLQHAISRYVQSRRQQMGQMTRNVASMTSQIEEPVVRGNDEQLMERITRSVNQHLGDSEFSVEQMCEEVGISRAHLHRKMKELTGFSVTEFVRNIRLEQAARLLREQKLNITQVAYTVGFSNLGYFSTVFRKQFGVSPRDFIAQG